MKYPLPIKKIVHNTRYLIKRINKPDSIQLDWSPTLNNFGDILNPVLINDISKRNIINVSAKYCLSEHLMAIGSILDRATKMTTVWGSGFISEESKYISVPKKICAVRGPLTREILLKNGVTCPEIYGDPALLLPQFYSPKSKVKYKLGILPHYIDKDSNWIKNIGSDVKIINIQNPNPLQVIDEICECENIASSSLHGIIISDAYKIPSVWIRLSNKIVGGNFKFHDYFSSIGTKTENPFIIDEQTSAKELMSHCSINEINLDLTALLNSFPKEYL